MNIEKTYTFIFEDTNIMFVLTSENKLRLVNFSAKENPEISKLDPVVTEMGNIVEVQITGYNQPEHKGNRIGNSEIGAALEFESIERKENLIFVTQVYNDGKTHLKTVTTISNVIGTNVFKWKTKLENIGNKIGVEYISSININNLNHGEVFQPYTDNILFLPHNSWQGELQWEKGTLKEFGLEYRLDGEHIQNSTKVISALSNCSFSCSQYSPQAVIHNPFTNMVSFWQIENNGEWYWELGDCGNGNTLQFRGFGPTEPTNHWWKSLDNGDSFETVTVAYGSVIGDFNEAMKELTSYRRAIRRPNEDNEKCAIIFNDYMNCLMGDPTTEVEKPLIDKAAEVGCEYYVIDCGWYSDGFWWDNVGEWLPSKERFPGGIEEVIQYIRDKGMVPGLWLEIEVMGINSDLANSLPDDWFICRHGIRVKDHSRYHLDFRNPKVREYASSVIDRLISDYKVGYIKMDYNITAGIGTDLNADSPSDGLLQHNRAYIKWLDKVFEKYPDLIIENCGSGGMRHDYMMLSRHSIQSVTDQTDYLRNGAIAAISSSGVTPEQAAIWSYPLSEGDSEEVIFNMVNAMLFRIHQSGHLAELSPKRLELVKQGLDVYKDIRNVIPKALPRWLTGIPKLDDPWFTFALETDESYYLGVWRTESLSNQFTIDFEDEISSVEVLYPYPENDDNSDFEFSKHKLNVLFSNDKMARLYKVNK
ncbi:MULTISPECIES: glycoside hydrolase family 36 protein [Enterococcus]|uniref:Alpha-galactosidase n=1 Tax=Candidatus Enterococcus ferrettii TaxID=2815324 RepID=A0ABV0ER96_9ENTE|nr:glycoside hydrolase family 36 protein [Enterococcus sp. 665A]MBO1339839.1 alpha-galactosidase [Enterococcus sp. 665A]